jgi:hypothetical protein
MQGGSYLGFCGGVGEIAGWNLGGEEDGGAG